MEAKIPEYIQVALKAHPHEAASFRQLPEVKRQEYVEWVNDPQLEDKRRERLMEMLNRLKEGKGPNE